MGSPVCREERSIHDFLFAAAHPLGAQEYNRFSVTQLRIVI
jgi:hypothetical protein